ncbi:MAG: NADH-quinone oxidoreductase subunit NuoE [Allobranchiibius sp.]
MNEQRLPTTSGSGLVTFRTTTIRLDRPGNPSVFGAQTRAEALQIIARYPAGQARSALLPLLHLVQSEQGYLTPDGIAFCAEQLALTKAQVGAVATFYTMFKLTPIGEYLISVCTNTLCGMLGGDEILAALQDTLGVTDSQSTPDRRLTLEHAQCLAACDYAPVLTVNYEFFDNQSVDTACHIASQLRAGERPAPTRGAPLCTFKQIERQIAGFFDEHTYAQDAPTSGTATEAGVTLAIQRGDTAPAYPTTQTGAATQAADDTAGRTSPQPTSSHDAPLMTVESDPVHPAQSGHQNSAGA